MTIEPVSPLSGRRQGRGCRRRQERHRHGRPADLGQNGRPPFDQLRFRLPQGARADAVLAFGTFVLVAVAEGQLLRSREGSTPVRLASWLLIVVVCGVLLFRRRYPVAVGWCTALGTGGYYLLSDTDGPLVVVPIVALYAIAAQGRLQAAVAMAAAMLIGMSAGTRPCC